MKQQLFFIFILYFICLGSLYAQKVPKKVRKNYENAQKSFKNNDFKNASDFFKLVYLYKEKTDLTAIATFYQALCEYKQESWQAALQSFENAEKFTENPKISNEAKFYLVDINFRLLQTEKALALIKKISDNSFKKELENMKGNYLKYVSTQRLKGFLETSPQDTLIAQIWIDKRAGEIENAKELDELQKICNQYGQILPEKRKLAGENYFKKTYNIAIILPFELNKFKKRADTSFVSKIALHLYQGMRIAKKELDTLDKKVNFKLRTYDLAKDDNESLQNLLKKDDWKDIDFVIGTIFEKQFETLTNELTKKKINFLFPMSLDDKLLKNEFAYSFLPTQNTQIEQLIDCGKTKYNTKSVVILYDNLPKNKVWAEKYKQNCENQGIEILLYQEMNPSELLEIPAALEKINTSNTGHIFISTTSQLLAQESLKYIKNRKFECPIFAPDAWFKFQDINFEMYEEQKVHFWIHDYIDTDNEKALAFKTKYFNFTRSQATQNSYIGYEMLHWVANILSKNGTLKSYEASLMKEEAKKGLVTPKIIINNKRTNQFVPIFKVEKGELKEVNF
ncbi:MAG: hypothetical protein EAZ85_10795 [Bacteroidetes bacterium]|nr:MAG: hypothetical protein EAZ85_10795 [Bacteroidota bacterium]TAG86067.1 MAG: hypothetical protein EAZ20_13560 [Bacteroidota bacterium]